MDLCIHLILMFLHLVLNFNFFYTTAGQNAEITVRTNSDNNYSYSILPRPRLQTKDTETRGQLTVCDTGCARWGRRCAGRHPVSILTRPG